MPTTGSYKFKLAAKAVNGIIRDAIYLEPGEWAWIDRTPDYRDAGGDPNYRWLMIYARCPDCGEPMTLYRKRGDGEAKGHEIDKDGNISPSVLHSWLYGDPPVERCGFHTQPTKLLGFMDLRSF